MSENMLISLLVENGTLDPERIEGIEGSEPAESVKNFLSGLWAGGGIRTVTPDTSGSALTVL